MFIVISAFAPPILSAKKPIPKENIAKNMLDAKEFKDAIVARWPSVNSFWNKFSLAAVIVPNKREVKDISTGDMVETKNKAIKLKNLPKRFPKIRRGTSLNLLITFPAV